MDGRSQHRVQGPGHTQLREETLPRRNCIRGARLACQSNGLDVRGGGGELIAEPRVKQEQPVSCREYSGHGKRPKEEGLHHFCQHCNWTTCGWSEEDGRFVMERVGREPLNTKRLG